MFEVFWSSGGVYWSLEHFQKSLFKDGSSCFQNRTVLTYSYHPLNIYVSFHCVWGDFDCDWLWLDESSVPVSEVTRHFM